MINLLSESAYVAQTNKIKTAITNKVNDIKASFTRIGAKLGAEINWLDDVESTLDDELTEINTELTNKGSTQADDFSEVAEKISDIQTGITPTGTLNITQNGTYDVTDYASASVAVAGGLRYATGTFTIDNPNILPVINWNLGFYPSMAFVKIADNSVPSTDGLDGCMIIVPRNYYTGTTINDYCILGRSGLVENHAGTRGWYGVSTTIGNLEMTKEQFKLTYRSAQYKWRTGVTYRWFAIEGAQE